MKPAAALVLAALAAGEALAQEATPAEGRRSAPPSKPDWSFAATLYPTIVRGGDNYTSGILAADRGPLHLEARSNYESQNSRSGFVGWTFSGGEAVTVEITPIVGAVSGSTNGAIAGIEASVGYGRFDFYLEGEYVRDKDDSSASYTYAWTELGFKAAEWLRLGIVGQRTRANGGEREIQRGPFVQGTHGPATFSAFWFNPGSSEQVLVLSLGVAF